MLRATCSGVDIQAAGTSTWIIPSLKENWAVWCPQRAISSSRARARGALCDTWGPSDQPVIAGAVCPCDMVAHPHDGFEIPEAQKVSGFHSVPFFFLLFSLFICSAMRSPAGFIPGEQREHIYSPVTHRLSCRSQGRSPSLSTSAWMFSAAFGINPWLPPPQRGHRKSCKSKRKKLTSFFMSSYPLFLGLCWQTASQK